ncbi:MAG TPA: ASKHA domain-containing protein, partial [Aggregatilineales bacterium]|nr:ASKHA domain-containing protein [Aggregatilineales bacterium]
PVGICGSGILDAVAAMADGGLVDSRGALQNDHPLISPGTNGTRTFVLAPADRAGHGHSILITRKDVAEIQLAKSAIRTGIELLIEKAGISAADIEEFIVAGAFGTYISTASALRIGMFPAIAPERIKQVGNAAGMGAWQLLISKERRQQAAQVVRDIHYLELTTHPGFQDAFATYMAL